VITKPSRPTEVHRTIPWCFQSIRTACETQIEQKPNSKWSALMPSPARLLSINKHYCHLPKKDNTHVVNPALSSCLDYACFNLISYLVSLTVLLYFLKPFSRSHNPITLGYFCNGNTLSFRSTQSQALLARFVLPARWT
jgi:hypothetical protein